MSVLHEIVTQPHGQIVRVGQVWEYKVSGFHWKVVDVTTPIVLERVGRLPGDEVSVTAAVLIRDFTYVGEATATPSTIEPDELTRLAKVALDTAATLRDAVTAHDAAYKAFDEASRAEREARNQANQARAALLAYIDGKGV